MTSNYNFLRRLHDLEEENSRLRRQLKATGQPDPNTVTTHVSMRNGLPVMRFEGAFRPFGIGLRKASIILDKIDDMRLFVESNKQYLADALDPDE